MRRRAAAGRPVPRAPAPIEKPDIFELDGSTAIAEVHEDDEGLADAVERSLLEEHRYRMRQPSTDIERDVLASVIELSKIEK